MKKRFLSTLLALCMMLTMAPVAFAIDEGTEETGQETVSSTSDNTSDNTDTEEGSGSGTSGSLPAADENGVITLTENVSIASGSWSLTNDVTIDLAQHTLTITGGATITVPNSKKLTLKNGTIMANSYANGTAPVFGADAGASITLDSITMTTNGAALFPAGSAAAVTVNNSNITAGTYVVGTNASTSNGDLIYSNNVKITLTDSTLKATAYQNSDKDTCPVMINVPGTLDITGCTITGYRQAVLVRGGTATITDSKLYLGENGTGDVYTGTDASKYDSTNWGSGNNLPMGALVVGNRVAANGAYQFPASCTLSGNTTVAAPSGKNAIYLYQMADSTVNRQVTLNIAGGTYGMVSFNNAEGAKANISITGGTFSSTISEDYLPTGYECTEIDSTWVVEAKQGLEADVSTGTNNTVAATVDGSYTGNETSSDEEDGDVSTSSGVVTIDVSASDDNSGDIKSAEVTIGSNALTSINNNTSVNTVVLETNVGSLTIDAAAWNSMTEAASENGIVVTLKDASTEGFNPVYEVTATAGEGNAFGEDAEGTVTISVPYTLPSGKSKVKVYCTDNGMEDMNAELVTDADSSASVQWTTSHFSTFEIPAYSDTDEVAYLASGENSSVTVGTFSNALTAVASSGGTITLLNDVTWNAETSFTTAKNVTIQGDKKIDVTVALSGNTSIKTAFVIQQSGSITLDGVTMNVTTPTGSEEGEGRNAAFSITNGAKLALVNGATLNLTGLQSGMYMPGSPTPVTATVSVSGEGSAINAKNIKGNFSNGGQFTIKDGASLTIDTCGSHGLSANKVTVDNASVTVKNTGLCGIVTVDTGSAVELKNGATVVVENCATAEDSNGRAAVELSKSNANMTVDKDSTLTVSGTGDRSKVALSNESGVTNTINGSIIGTVTQGDVTTTYYEITFDVTPSDASIVVKDSDGNQVSAVDGKYALENGKDYTYTVSKSGYRTQTSTFTVAKAETITVTLSTSGGGGGGGSSSSSYAVDVSSASNGTVTVSPKNASKGATVTITVTPNSGYELDELTVTDKNGDTVKLTNKGNGKYTFTMPASKVTVKAIFEKAATEPETPVFTDVSTSAYYYDAVEWAVEEGVTSGTTATTFSPNASCTRAQMVTFLWRANGSPKAGGTNPFTDVKPDAYYYDAVLWAVEKGITSGTSATTFSPDATVTRGQTVTFLYRANGSPAVSGSSPFADVAADAYYAAAVQWAVAENVTAGTSATTFSPNNACTRAQIVTFLYRDMA